MTEVELAERREKICGFVDAIEVGLAPYKTKILMGYALGMQSQLKGMLSHKTLTELFDEHAPDTATAEDVDNVVDLILQQPDTCIDAVIRLLRDDDDVMMIELFDHYLE